MSSRSLLPLTNLFVRKYSLEIILKQYCQITDLRDIQQKLQEGITKFKVQ